jgi:hypothetical protein
MRDDVQTVPAPQQGSTAQERPPYRHIRRAMWAAIPKAERPTWEKFNTLKMWKDAK